MWDVIPQENGTLDAKRLKTLPLPYDGFESNLSLNEHIAARSMKRRVDVYWWKKCTESQLVWCTLLFDTLINNIYVLGNDKLLVYTSVREFYDVQLFALEPEYSKVGDYQKVAPRATEIWSIEFSCKNDGSEISRLYFDGTNYRQTIATLDGIFSLTIPASHVNKATFEKVSDFDRYQQGSRAEVYGMGFNTGYCRTNKQLYRFGFKGGSNEGNYESGATFDERINRILKLLQRPHSFDDELGRLVSVAHKQVVLQDFSRPMHNLALVCPDSDQFDEANSWDRWKEMASLLREPGTRAL